MAVAFAQGWVPQGGEGLPDYVLNRELILSIFGIHHRLDSHESEPSSFHYISIKKSRTGFGKFGTFEYQVAEFTEFTSRLSKP